MNNDGSANKLLSDDSGASLIEATAVFPLVLLLTLGLVDLGLIMFSWAEGNRAAYAGARYATTHKPVATNINLPIGTTSTGSLGSACFDTAVDGTVTATGFCQTRASAQCTGTGQSTVACTGGYTADVTAFGEIVSEMNKLFSSQVLDYRQVRVTYEPLPLSVAGRPGGPPMNITVSLRCLKQEVYFLSALAGWAFPALENDCSGLADNNGIPLPQFSTTLPSEDLQ